LRVHKLAVWHAWSTFSSDRPIIQVAFMASLGSHVSWRDLVVWLPSLTRQQLIRDAASAVICCVTGWWKN